MKILCGESEREIKRTELRQARMRQRRIVMIMHRDIKCMFKTYQGPYLARSCLDYRSFPALADNRVAS